MKLQKYGIYKTGGSIGEKSNYYTEVFDKKSEAITAAKRMRSHLSQGERKYYKMSYKVKKIPQYQFKQKELFE